jgi:hypothetical protein
VYIFFDRVDSVDVEKWTTWYSMKVQTVISQSARYINRQDVATKDRPRQTRLENKNQAAQPKLHELQCVGVEGQIFKEPAKASGARQHGRIRREVPCPHPSVPKKRQQVKDIACIQWKNPVPSQKYA